jgi:hypothetical protein
MLTLFKYRCFTNQTDKDRIRNILMRQEIYCSTPDELDDPYDCNIGTADGLMGMLVTHAVFCTCGDQHNDILLYSQYADRHTGLALVFTVEDGGTNGDSTFLGFAEKVTYVNGFPTFDKNNIHQVLLTKYTAWSYQDEYRIIACLDHDPKQQRQFKKKELTEIRFGLKMKEADQQLIMQWASAASLTGIRFFKARLREDKFQLAYDPIP